MKVPWGQVEIPAAVLTAGIALMASGITGVVTYTLAEARATMEFRAELKDHREALAPLRGLPVEDLKKLPARVETIAAASEVSAKAVLEMRDFILRGVRPAGGKRP